MGCVAKNELYDLDLMQPDPRRIEAGERREKKEAAAATTAASASASAPAPVSSRPRSDSPFRPGRARGPLYPAAPGFDDRRSRHASIASMILTQTLSHVESNAVFYPSHEPLKNPALALTYALREWWEQEEKGVGHAAFEDAEATEEERAKDAAAAAKASYFSFVFDKRKKDIAGYITEKLRSIEPHAEELLKAGFPLRA